MVSVWLLLRRIFKVQEKVVLTEGIQIIWDDGEDPTNQGQFDKPVVQLLCEFGSSQQN